MRSIVSGCRRITSASSATSGSRAARVASSRCSCRAGCTAVSACTTRSAGDAPRRGDDHDDIHAAGTAGGGTAIGGLAGTNIGEGDPDDGDLEEAMGSGDYDQALEDDHEDTSSYSGPTGGAVGGAVADRRAVGGKTGGGLAPQPGPGDSPVGQ